MEILSGVLKRYLNLSLLETILFLLFGVAFYYVLESSPFFWFLNTPNGGRDLNSFPRNIFFIFFWFLIFFVGGKIIISVFKLLSSFRKYNFKSNHWPKEWKYQGNIRLGDEEDSLLVTDSNSGCILKNHYWKNLEINFKCKFPVGCDDQTLGIIFRAKSLSDYLMIQINNKEVKIVPHIRSDGNWETMRLSTYDIDLIFEENVFFDVQLRVFNEKVQLFINGNIQLDWNIPTNTDLKSADTNKRHEDTYVPNINFRNAYGMIGFRAYQGESAVVKNLSVRRIAEFF